MHLYCNECEKPFSFTDAQNILCDDTVVVGSNSLTLREVQPICCPSCEEWANVCLLRDDEEEQ